MILVVAQVEDRGNLDKQIAKQTIQPDDVFIYIDKNPANTIDTRRQRIAENHKILVEAVKKYKPDFVWQLEGDVDLPEDCLERLIKDHEELSKFDHRVGYVSGIQVGRHGLYCLGAWRFPNNKDSETFESLNYKLNGLQHVDATGFYCLLASTDIWLKGKVYWWESTPYGPDVNFGLSLSEQNYNLYCDMSLTIGHIVKKGIIRPEHASTCNARFYEENGRWKFQQLN